MFCGSHHVCGHSHRADLLPCRPAHSAPAEEHTPGRDLKGTIYWPALIAAIVIALSFWHLSLATSLSRDSIATALGAGNCLLLASLGSRTQSSLWLGRFLAGAYPVHLHRRARLLPLVVALFVLVVAGGPFFAEPRPAQIVVATLAGTLARSVGHGDQLAALCLALFLHHLSRSQFTLTHG